MKLFKFLIVSTVVLHMALVIAAIAITVHQPPQQVAKRPACAVSAPAITPASDCPTLSPAPRSEGPRRVERPPAPLLALPVLVFMVIGTWMLGRAMACCDGAYPLPGGPASPVLVAHLREQTRGPGEFVILAHTTEDLQPRPGELQAALVELCAEDPQLEVRKFADRWVLRRPRV